MTDQFLPSDPVGIDLSFRPKSYFWPLPLRTHVLSSIKGAFRRSLVEKEFDEGRLDEVPLPILQPALSENLRSFTGSLHPMMMGGEYLPDQEPDEIEVARVTLASTLQDVTAVYAKRQNSGISYRIVDEYDGACLTGVTECRSELPLTLGELTDFFLGGWDLLEVLEMNFDGDGCAESKVMAFYQATSEFYSDFGRLVDDLVSNWVREAHARMAES